MRNSAMERRQNKLHPSEGDVVSGQSRVDKAKYLHTENNLRKTLSDISESFRRTNKKLSEETEVLREELNKLRQSVQKVNREKQRRITGECSSSQRPHRAERLLCDETIVKLEPFGDCQKFVYKRKSQKAKGRYLTPLRLHENRTSVIDSRALENDKEAVQEQLERSNNHTLREIQTYHTTTRKTVSRPQAQKTIALADDYNYRHSNVTDLSVWKSTQSLTSQENSGPRKIIARIPVCELVDIGDCEKDSYSCRVTPLPSKPHFLPPLERIPEVVEPTGSFSPTSLNSKPAALVFEAISEK